MTKYQSGQKVVQGRIAALQREMEVLQAVVPVYDVETGFTYAKGLVALRKAYTACRAGLQPVLVKKDGSYVVRPMTFEETIDARVNDYETLRNSDGSARTEEERLRLFNLWLDSCTGTAYKGKTSKFKVVPVSVGLILLNPNFAQAYVSVEYGTQEGVELDRAKGKFNVPLTKSQYLVNSGWCAAVPDKALRRALGNIVYSEKKADIAMGFYVQENPAEDCLLALAVCHLYSSASDWSGLYGVRFVRVSPK